jgi:hypothetical protein
VLSTRPGGAVRAHWQLDFLRDALKQDVRNPGFSATDDVRRPLGGEWLWIAALGNFVRQLQAFEFRHTQLGLEIVGKLP